MKAKGENGAIARCMITVAAMVLATSLRAEEPSADLQNKQGNEKASDSRK